MAATAHPVFRLLLAHPELLAEHASAYGEVVRDELRAAAAAWQRRVRLQLLAGGALLAAVVLAGNLLMWWTVLPNEIWLSLLGIPGLPLLVGLWAWWAASRTVPPGDAAWLGLRRQLQADLALVRDSAGAA